MRKTTKYIIATVISLGIAGSVFANANGYCDQEGRFEKHGAKVMHKISKKLDLNDAQQVQLEALQAQVKAKMSGMHEGKAAKKAEIMALFGEQFKQNDALIMLQERAAKMNENAPEMVHAFGNFYDSLDTEQQTKMRTFIEKRGTRGFMGFGGKGQHQSKHQRGHWGDDNTDS
ncbi:MAG: Spy/CpxP family protein refolding chaperone [Arenicellales bacterium]